MSSKPSPLQVVRVSREKETTSNNRVQATARKAKAGEKRFAADIPEKLHRAVRGYCVAHDIQMQTLLVEMLADRGITEKGFPSK